MTKEEAIQDLAIRHYPGKWREAQRLAHNEYVPVDHRGLDYWERVRRLYLELGGEYIRQLDFLSRLRYLLPTDSAHKV